jgi:signal peptidase I
MGTEIKETAENSPSLSVRLSQELYEWAETIVFVLAAVILVFTFVLRTVSVGGMSMENTLNAGVTDQNQFVDRVLLYEYHYTTPKQGDIVAISSPVVKKGGIIKRVIAVGGDTVNIDFKKHIVYVNGKVLKEPYIKEPTAVQGDVQFPIKVPKGHVFVMGDNRNISYDSRYRAVGMVDDRDIIGRAFVRIIPLNEIKWLG